MSAKRILIVDDEYDIRAVAELAIKTVAGWEVLTATSGSEGLNQAAKEQPDAILLDVMMPEMDGIATLQALQANPATKSIPVILMTAKAQAADQRRFAELGVAGIITKPFKAMQLSAQVVAALGW
ncbi:MAG TPA: two-component system response regulator [Cyanobacteria bacterium UBA11369]|nr:two-component system response regulator [Cyanobacteria bacterium UBA11371]HBE33321.1 two-component system response regulator [Cyanobacteria bacterium UBA11368]HBE54225.1 two-component system response regulator [Cyanobacteria bacterium UBA11369]